MLRAAIWPALLEALGGATVELDGAPVRADTAPLAPLARVFDEGPDVVLLVERSPELDEVVAPGVGRVGGVLRPLELIELRVDERHDAGVFG